MRDELLLTKLPSHFDYPPVMERLSGFKKPRDKLSALVAQGDVIRVKKGIYVLGKNYGRPYSQMVLANLIFGPSYVSGLSALAFWGAIPERTETVLSVTPKRKKLFTTPAGTFEYQYCKLSAYQLGFQLVELSDSNSAFVAGPEKALSDWMATQGNPKSLDHIGLLLSGLRLDANFLTALNFSLLTEIAERYRQKGIDSMVQYLENRK